MRFRLRFDYRGLRNSSATHALADATLSLKSARTRTASTRSPKAFSAESRPRGWSSSGTIFRATVIDLAGSAANGVRGHVGLTADALAFKYFCAKCEKEYKAKSDHNGIKGYFSA